MSNSENKAHETSQQQTNLNLSSQQRQQIKQSNHNRSATQPQHFQSPSPFNLQQQTVSMRKDHKINQLMVQNKRLRIANKQLKRQLQIFEKRLDQTLKKRTVSQKKPRVSKQIVESMELKNAYKQCEIYKRQINQFKKREAMFDENKIQQLNDQITQFEIDRSKFLQEIKSLKLQNKQQQKGLLELTGGKNYQKMIKQFEQLKHQNKKLQQKLNKQGRESKLKEMTQTNERRKLKQTQVKNTQQKKKQEQKQNSQLQILKMKTDKDNKKILLLSSENNKLNQALNELRNQIEEKDKEIQALRKRLIVLRKQRKQKNNSRLETQPEKNQMGNSTLRRSYSKSHNRQKSQISSTHENTKAPGKYPRLQEAGQKNQSSFKWNHHQFSSKIKQISVVPHQNGHIGQIYFRYEKGEPNPVSAMGNKMSFVCDQNGGQYVKRIRGGFKDNILRFIIVQSSKNRVFKFGQHELQNQCINFNFGRLENEFPGAFFGENNNQGINRIGCLVEIIK